MKRLLVATLMLGLIFVLVGCQFFGGGSGLGTLIVKNAKIDNTEQGKVHVENIDKVIVKGEFTNDGWGTWLDLVKGTDGIWRLPFSTLEGQPVVGQEYGFAYWSTEDGITPDNSEWGEWMNSQNLKIAEGQTEFVFDPEVLAKLKYFKVSDATVKIGEEQGKLREEIKVVNGNYNVVVQSSRFIGTTAVVIEIGKTTTVDEVILLDKPIENYEIVFNPTDYPVDIANPADIENVYLIGSMNEWNIKADPNYKLTKQSDGTWSGKFTLYVGEEYKFCVEIEDGSYINDGYVPSGMGNNLVVTY